LRASEDAAVRFACSNLAWSPDQEAVALRLLGQAGVTGVEIAPTRIWPGLIDASVSAARAEAARLADLGFAVPAVQALLFGEPKARMFDQAGVPAFRERLIRIASLASALGAKVAVLGAPASRDPGALEFDRAVEQAVPLLRGLARVFEDQGVVLCIEPVPQTYGCRFINTALQAFELVRAVDHPGCGLHLDAAALHLSGETLMQVWPQVGACLRHFHLSEPALGGFRTPLAPHAANLQWLSDHAYSGYVSIEMLDSGDPLDEAGPWQLLEPYRRDRLSLE